jgi:hypothetical protein
MNNTRLRQLEERLVALEKADQALSPADGCPACRERRSRMFVTCRTNAADLLAGREPPLPDDARPCPVCKWQPKVINEVLVNNREEAAAVLRLNAAETNANARPATIP